MYDSESFSEVFYVACERGMVLRAFLNCYFVLFLLYVFHHIHYTLKKPSGLLMCHRNTAICYNFNFLNGI